MLENGQLQTSACISWTILLSSTGLWVNAAFSGKKSSDKVKLRLYPSEFQTMPKSFLGIQVFRSHSLPSPHPGTSLDLSFKYSTVSIPNTNSPLRETYLS